MSAKHQKKMNIASSTVDYSNFNQLDGDHPWMKAAPAGYVPYKVRELRTGTVAYFNYPLAKEMGLIPATHPENMTAELHSKLIETFSLQIINEYDELSQQRIDPATIKPKAYMASRYLQLQHESKTGKTSGDGRGIWNGTVEHRGRVWDVSSRGTGVTCLAPGAVQANKPLKTGGTQFGYGCGQAEIDELYGAAILAEIFHLQGIRTERVLCVIDLGKGVGIGVRAAPNLLRPAHLFPFLKQNRWQELKNALDYFIDRQVRNGRWKLSTQGPAKYEEVADIMCREFAEFTAILDIDYIFAWLDWDGDNVLADAGIIDYGSVRQFGIRHDKYRYDDVERFSTNLNEQKKKSQLIVQTLVQLCDYVKTKTKKPLKDFAQHSTVKKFNSRFAEYRTDRLLYRMGFSETQRQNIRTLGLETFQKFDREFSYFERAKISGPVQKVADGINHPALFNMRKALRLLPRTLFTSKAEAQKTENEFFKSILSSFAKAKDTHIRMKHRKHIQSLLELYSQLVTLGTKKEMTPAVASAISKRADRLNSELRITGNALIQIVNEILDQKKKGLDHQSIQNVIDHFILQHLNFPEVKSGKYYSKKPKLVTRPEFYEKLLKLIHVHQEDI
jgi:hypothetical protein